MEWPCCVSNEQAAQAAAQMRGNLDAELWGNLNRERAVATLHYDCQAGHHVEQYSNCSNCKLQAAQAADELRGNLDAERAAVIAYWRSVHEELLAPWQVLGLGFRI